MKSPIIILSVLLISICCEAFAADWRVWYESDNNFNCYIDVSSIVHLNNNKVRAWSKCGFEHVEFLYEIDCNQRRYLLREARSIQNGEIDSREEAEVYNQDGGIWKYLSSSDTSNAQYNAWCKSKYGGK